MALVLAQQPWLIFLDDDGHFVPAGQLAVYQSGTSTPVTVYQDINATPHPWPITLDSAGRVPGALYLAPGLSYKFVLHAPRIILPLSGAVLKSQDNVQGGGGLITITGSVPSAPNLPPTGDPGDAYITLDDGHLWIWDESQGIWVDAGPVQGPPGPPGVIAPHAPTHDTGGLDPILHLAGEVIDTGIVSAARMSPLVPLKNTENTFTALNQFALAGPYLSGPFFRVIALGLPAEDRNWLMRSSGGAMEFLAVGDDLTTILGSVVFGRDGSVSVTGIVNATGLGATPLNATNLLTGTVPDARLSPNVLTHGGGYPGGATFLRADGTFATPSAGVPGPHQATHGTGGADEILNIDAARLTVGVLADARLAINVLRHAGGYPGGTVTFLRADGTFAAPPGGGGGVPDPHRLTHETGGSDALQALSAAILTTGQLPDARLSVNVLKHTAGYPGGTANFLRADGAFAAPPTGGIPSAHRTTHETGGADALQALSAAILTAGTLPDARFPAVLPAVSGANLTNLNATALATGTVANARLTADVLRSVGGYPNNTVSWLRADGNWTAIPAAAPAAHATTHNTGGSDPITALVATVLTTGTLPDARLSASVARRDLANTFTNANTFDAATAFNGVTFRSSAAAPQEFWTATGAPANQKTFRITVTSAGYFLQPIADNEAAQATFSMDRAGVISAPGQLCAYVRLGSSLNNSNATPEVISFDVEVFDVGGCHSPGSASLVVPAGGAGTYSIVGTMIYDANATGARMARILRNGAVDETVFQTAVPGGNNSHVQVQTILQLAVGEAISLQAYQTSGSPLNVIGSNLKWVKLW